MAMISCRRRVGVTGRGGSSAARAGVAVSASPARLYDVKTRIVLTTRLTTPNTQMGTYQMKPPACRFNNQRG
jgi:hypothetical protein